MKKSRGRLRRPASIESVRLLGAKPARGARRLPRERHAKSHPSTAKQTPRDFFIKRLGSRRTSAQIGFTLIESLVALSILAFTFALGLGALAAVQHGLDLSVLQRTLDQQLDTCHEALRGGLVDTEQLVEFGGLYLDPETLESSTLPSVGGGPAQVRIDVVEGDLAGLYDVELRASGLRGRIERTRRLRTKIYVPGAAR